MSMIDFEFEPNGNIGPGITTTGDNWQELVIEFEWSTFAEEKLGSTQISLTSRTNYDLTDCPSREEIVNHQCYLRRG